MASKPKPDSRTSVQEVEDAARVLSKSLFQFFTTASKQLASKEKEEWDNSHFVTLSVEAFERFRNNGTQGTMNQEPVYEVPEHVLAFAKKTNAARRVILERTQRAPRGGTSRAFACNSR